MFWLEVLKGYELFLASNEIRMIFCNSVSSLFSESGITTPAKVLQTLRFPGSAVFHRRVDDFRLRIAVYTTLYSYTYAKPLCMYVCRPGFAGARYLWRRPAFPALTFTCIAPHSHTLPHYTRHVVIACV